MDFYFFLDFLAIVFGGFFIVCVITGLLYQTKKFLDHRKDKKEWQNAQETGVWWKYDKEKGWTPAVNPLFDLEGFSEYPLAPPYDDEHPEPAWSKDLRIYEKQNNAQKI